MVSTVTKQNSSNQLIPVEGCWVSRTRSNNKELGVVVNNYESEQLGYVKVNWSNESEELMKISDLKSGFQNGWYVKDAPVSTTRTSLGLGKVIATRTIANHQQVLVQLQSDGRLVWFPYENLRRVKDVRLRFLRSETGKPGHSNRFRLKLLANALENWNLLTGSLDRLDVDPLPHQIQLVYRILNSGNYNWVIADDVGLGKTIEMGLVLAGLARSGYARRVLVVCPAGLQKQWKNELSYKFEQNYDIYGIDFSRSVLDKFSKVIVSIDRAKNPDDIAKFEEGDSWDVIVFDEGHKLTRHEDGRRTQRYQLATVLRKKSDAMFLLTGTPHQGYHGRFVALLQLVRPDLTEQLIKLNANKEVVAEIVLRNRKSLVTDAEGHFIFKGLNVRRVPVQPSSETKVFQKKLNEYLREGYKSGELTGKRAIGFVMTIYRKLASSSIAAIEAALQKRLSRLDSEDSTEQGEFDENYDNEVFENLLEGGDEQDDLEDTHRDDHSQEFFHLEKTLLHELLDFSSKAKKQDEKLNLFLNQVAELLVSEGKKLLIFTEYRATQKYLKDALENRFPESEEVLLVNGSMNLRQKLEVIERFNDEANGSSNFLVSTEAGGEGFNLHYACHVMVNYDLPWNPARLQQRIGRLYRYGQHQPVLVINLHASDSFDNQAIGLMLDRVSQIVEGMAKVGNEFNNRLYAEILGDMLDNLDFGQILHSTSTLEVKKSHEEIEAAVQRAKKARELQDEVLSSVNTYDPQALEATLGITIEHASAFVFGMLSEIGVSIEEKLHGDRILVCRLPEKLRGKFSEFQNRTVVRLTTDRRLAQRYKDTVLLDFENRFFQYLIEEAKSFKFNGLYSCIHSRFMPSGILVAAKLRWQNDQGNPGTEEFVTVYCKNNNTIQLNPPFLSEWLLEEAEDAEVVGGNTKEERTQLINQVENYLSEHLQSQCSIFKHPNSIVLLASADIISRP